MRLIDADALKKAIDLPFLENIKLGKIINDAPTIDAVEVVRCKDCFMKDECKAREFYGDNGYCSIGERREP